MASSLLCCHRRLPLSAPKPSLPPPRRSWAHRSGVRCSSSRPPQFESDEGKKESSFGLKECAFSIALSLGLVTGVPQLGWAARASLGPVVPDLAVLISGPPIKDPGALLRYALPIDNKAVREVQKPLEDITDSLKNSGVKALDSVERNLRQASRALSQGKAMILAGVAEPKKAHGKELLDKLEVGMEELQRIVEERNRDAVTPKQKELLQYVGAVEEDMVGGFPYEVPEEYSNMPLLKGRATVDMKVKVKDNPNIQDCVFRIVLDGYNAPVTAGNFVDLVERHFYDGMEIQRADGFVVQTGDPEGPAEGFIDPSTEKIRTIPLEIMVYGDKTPVYGETLEELGRYKAQTRLPFNAFGTMAMARDEFEDNSASSQVFWLLKESELTPSNANILDGRYVVFGYVTENEDYLADLKVGDVIESIQRMSDNDYTIESDAAPSTGGKKKRKTGGKNQRWTEAASVFLIQFMARLVREGVKGDLNSIVAKEVNNKFELPVSDKHVYNHLRAWKTKWSRICTLKTLSGCVAWKPEIQTIEMPEEIYTEYIKVHEKDKPFLNQPIEHYNEMYILFGGEKAKGRYATDDNQPIGDPAHNDIRGGSFNTGSPLEAGRSIDQPESMSLSQRSKGKGKRKDVELEIMGSFADSFKKFANTIYEKREEDKKVIAKCYEQLRSMVGMEYDYYIFTEDEVSAAYDYFVKNPDIGAGFLSRRTEVEKAAWLYRFSRKNNSD